MTKKCRQLPDSIISTPTGRPRRPKTAVSETISRPLLCPKYPQQIDAKKLASLWANSPPINILSEPQSVCSSCRKQLEALGCTHAPYVYRYAHPNFDGLVVDTETTGFSNSDSVVEFGASSLSLFGWMTNDRPERVAHRSCWRCDLNRYWQSAVWDDLPAPLDRLDLSEEESPRSDLGTYGSTKPCLFWPVGNVLQGYARPETRFNFFASRVTGLTSADLENEQPVEDLLLNAAGWALGRFVFAHNAAFDTRMITKTVGSCWRPYQTVCTLRLMKAFFPDCRADLNSCLRRSRVSQTLVDTRENSCHGAAFDARVTAELIPSLQDFVAVSFGNQADE